MRWPKSRERLRREAAGWLARLRGGPDPATERRFREWRDRDPAHAAAFESVQRSFGQAGLLRHSPARMTPAAVAANDGAGRPSHRWAAAAAIALIVPAAALLGGRLLDDRAEAMVLYSAAGQIRQVALEDGSRVTLDSGSRLKVAISSSRRSAELERGRVRFRIATAPSSFVVRTSVAVVEVDEAAVLDVDATGSAPAVDVLEGKATVRSSAGGAGAEVTGGHYAVPGAAGIETGPSRKRVPDWTSGMLRFDNLPLSEAAALAGRYSDRRIAVSPEIADLRVTGGFRAGDSRGLARALAAAFRLSLQEGADGSLILSPRTSPRSGKKKGG